MRIISGRDYYDNALAYGRDETILFVRERDRWLKDAEVPSGLKYVRPYISLREINKKTDVAYRGENIYVVDGRKYFLNALTVMFCGKVYHGISIEQDGGGTVYFWQKDQFEEFIGKLGLECYRHSYRFDIDPKTFFDPYNAPRTLMDWLIDMHITLAVRFPSKQPEKWSINSDRLKEVQFYRALDAFTAFQEISMWIGGVIPGHGNQMVAIPDIIRIEKHGFDKKFSFRKQPK